MPTPSSGMPARDCSEIQLWGVISGRPSQVASFVQAMAGFGGGSGAADGVNAVVLGADASEQPLLTTPQHA
jgi:hypothetical protein